MAKKKKRRTVVTAPEETPKPKRTGGNTSQVRHIKNLRNEPSKPRSVDNDILFGLPMGKAMIASLAVGVACYVFSYIFSLVPLEDVSGFFHVASFALFALAFVFLVVARVQGKRRTAERRAEQQ